MATKNKNRGAGSVEAVVDGLRIPRLLRVADPTRAEAAVIKVEPASARGNPPLPLRDVTLPDLLPYYLTYCEARNTPKTMSLKRTYLRRLAEFAGNVPLRKIKRADIEDYISHRLASGNVPAINREMTVFRHFFGFAAERELIDKNPCRGIKKLPEKRRPIKLLTEQELCAYFDYCRENDPLLYDLSMIAYFTGLRRGDIVKIQGADVDVERRTLTVQVSKLNGELILRLPLNERVFGVLVRRKGEHGDGYLFPGRRTPHLVDFKTRFSRAKKATGLNFRFMEFRHNCATALLRKGVDVYTVKEILGHSSITTTARYLRLIGDGLREAMAKLDLGNADRDDDYVSL